MGDTKICAVGVLEQEKFSRGLSEPTASRVDKARR